MSGGRLQITLEPEVLQWARERARLDPEQLAEKMKVRLDLVLDWESSGAISFSNVDKLAQHTHTPLGFLYLSEPPDDRLPIQDFRTTGNHRLKRPSPELIDTIHAMQRRQAWMRDDLIEDGAKPLSFVRSANLSMRPGDVAVSMRDQLGFTEGWAQAVATWVDALRHLRDRIDQAGVMVVMNGVVGNNTSRKLDPQEFRGFALVDDYAPLLFVNNSDAKSAQMFTLIHELAHIWVGAEGVSNLESMQPSDRDVERFCNAVAAEFLVPAHLMRSAWTEIPPNADRFNAIARRFKVSRLVAARRALDLQLIGRDVFFAFYRALHDEETRHEKREEQRGNFWNTQYGRIGRRFGGAVVQAVREGRLLYSEAYELTGLKSRSFDRFAENVEG